MGVVTLLIEDNLATCYRVANELKSEFPNEVMKITPTTIIEFSKKNSRLLSNGRKRRSMSGCYAYFTHATPHRVIIKQKTLKEGEIYSTYGGKHSLSIVPKYKKYVDLYNYTIHGGLLGGRKKLQGNWAMIDLMCHEFAHHRTRGHAKGFKTKYHRFLNHMTNRIISGEFYR